MRVENPIKQRIAEIIATGTCSEKDFIIPSHNAFHEYAFDMDLDADGRQLLENAFNQLHFSESKLERLERIALSIQKLEKSNMVTACIIAEAIGYVTD